VVSAKPVLLVGGSGVVGRWTAKFLRDAHPDVPFLIGGRDLAKAEKVAAEIGNAEGIVLDLAGVDLGLGERAISAVAVFFIDYSFSGLRLAQARGVPYVSMSSLGIHEIGPEVAGFMYKPHAAPVVLGTEWFVGVTTIFALEFAKAFRQVQAITIGALLDETDAGGPAQAVDLERVTKLAPPALARRDGAYYWRIGNEAKAKFHAVDGTEMDASALSPYDVVALATATGAPNVHFNLATGMSSTRRRGEPMSTEVIIELAGTDHKGQSLRTRHAVVHPEGQMPPTALGVAMVLERLLGLDGDVAVPSGLYFPNQLLRPTIFFERFKQIGGHILTLDAP
jgi:hypothetical protein